MRTIIGSVAPLMPMTGYFNCRREAREWAEGNLENWNGYFTLRGKGEVIFPDARVETNPGDFLLLPPGVARSYRILRPSLGWEFYWLHFRATPRLSHTLDWFDRSKRFQIHPVTDISLQTTIARLLEDAHQLNLTQPDLPHRETILDAQLEVILLRISVARHQTQPDHGIDTRIEKVLEHFHCDIAAPSSVARLARLAGLSRSQFNLLFRAGTGKSPQQYVEERRLEMAAYYIRTSKQAIAEVAQTVGFSNSFYFSQRFHRRFGKSPSAYRLGPR